MKNIHNLNKKQKWLLFVLLVILYFTLLYIFKYYKGNYISIIDKILDFVTWPLIFYLWIFKERKGYPKSILYFKEKDYDEIVSQLQSMGFDKIKDTARKSKFADKNKWWRKHHIYINKNENGIWQIEGNNEFIDHFEKYIVKYSRR